MEGQRLLHSIRFTNILSYGAEMKELRLEPLNVFIGTNASGKSILSQRRDVDLYPELTYVAMKLAEMRFFREGNLGRRIAPRVAQQVDLPEDFLLEDASNLWLVLANLISEPELKGLVLDRLRAVYGELEDIRVKIQGGTVQVFFYEEGLHRPVPGFRLSDGMLRFLCLLTILHHPSPPPLVAIESWRVVCAARRFGGTGHDIPLGSSAPTRRMGSSGRRRRMLPPDGPGDGSLARG